MIGDQMHPWIYYTLEISRDRERQAASDRLARDLRPNRPERPSRFRRSTALALAALTRGSANVVRRLDECVADDLEHALAGTE
jgi:hypothetical protein